MDREDFQRDEGEIAPTIAIRRPSSASRSPESARSMSRGRVMCPSIKLL